MLLFRKILKTMQGYGLTFKGKPVTEANAKALKNLAPFVGHGECRVAFALVEAVCPELREPTLLLRIAQLSTGQAGGVGEDAAAGARAAWIFVFDPLRVLRLCGDCPKDDVYTVSRVTGQEKKSAALVHKLFKKQELVEFVFHEAALIQPGLPDELAMLRTPLSLVVAYAEEGPGALAASLRLDEVSASGECLETMFAVAVTTQREKFEEEPKKQFFVDILWGVWSGAYDDEIHELVTRDLQNMSPSFLWHQYLTERQTELGVKYRAFLAACCAGPIVAASGAVTVPAVMGTSELGEAEKQELRNIQALLMILRRKKCFLPVSA